MHIGTFRSLMTDILALHDRGDGFTVYDECGNTLLADARALMVAKFLESDATDMMFVDTDVVWEAGTLLKLVDVPYDCVAAIYPHRSEPITYPVVWDPDQDELWANEHGLLEVDAVPFGCVRCSRSMIERMVEHYADMEFFCSQAKDEKAWALFDPLRIKDNLKCSEDISFCRRWRAMGGKIHIMPEVKMGHTGFKTFVGNIGEWLRNRINEPSTTEMVKALNSVPIAQCLDRETTPAPQSEDTLTN